MSTRRILLIEDDESEAHLALRTLKKISPATEIIHCWNGAEFLECLERHSHENIALVLTDLHMPRMNGLALLESLANRTRRLGFPLVVFSSSTDPQEIERAYHLGASAFVTKPDEPAEYRRVLKNTVAFWLSTNRMA